MSIRSPKALLLALAALPVLAGCAPAGPVPPTLDRSIHTDPLIHAAVDEATAAIEADPTSVEARVELAKYFAACDLHAQARTAFEQALEVGAEDAQTLAFLAYECHALGDPEAAVEHMLAARAVRPDFAPLAWWTGFWLLEQGDAEGAVEHFREATRIDAKDVQGWIGLGRATMQMGEPEAALEFLRRAGELAKARVARYVAHLNGTALQRLGRSEEAARYFAVGDPQDMQRTDRWRKSLREYAVGFHGRSAEARRALRAGRTDQAIEILEPLLEHHDMTRGLIDNLASCYLTAGRLDDVLEILQRYETEPTPSANSWYLMAVARLGKGGSEEAARPLLERSLGVNPRFSPTLVRLAQFDLEEGAYASALERLEVALTDDAAMPAWHVMAGRAASEAGIWDRAVVHLGNAVRFFPNDRSVREAFERARTEQATAAEGDQG